MSCDVGKATEGLENELGPITMGGLPGDVSEELVTQEKQKKVQRMSCGVGEAMEGLDNEL